MSCNCKLYQRRLEKVQKKYNILRKNHKKLLGVTVLLTDALEQLVKGEKKTGINDILLTCSSMYPDLFGNTKSLDREKTPDNINNESAVESNPVNEENVKVCDPATELEKEYYEGFMSRPKIPRSL